MADSAFVAGLKGYAAAEPLAFRPSHINRSTAVDVFNSRDAPEKPQPRILVPKPKRRSLKAMQCRAMPPLECSCLELSGSEEIVCTNVFCNRVFAAGRSCRDAWSPVKFLCRTETTERGSFASAAVAAAAAVTLGLSLSLSLPAIAETAGLSESSVGSGYTADDIDAQLSREQTLALNFELQRLSPPQNDLRSEQAASSIIHHRNENKGEASITDSITSSSVSSPVKKALRSPVQSGDRSATINENMGLLIPASCPPSNLVAVAAVGSMASATSMAGSVVAQSTVFSQPSLALPGAQLLERVLQHLGGGGVAGAIGASLVYPLDTVKTRMQAQNSKGDQEPQYKDEIDCFRRLLIDEGLGSLYNGLLPQLVGIAPEKALKLTVNEVLLQSLEQLLPGARVWLLEFIAGGGGGFSQVLVTNPMEIVKLRLQMQSDAASAKKPWQVVKELGLQGLYCGSGITLARDVPGTAIFFACYALLNQVYPGQSFWAGFLAAIPATILVTPFDVVKTRLQMETPAGEQPYRDAWHCFRVLWQQEGFRGLFKGGLMRILRTSPQFGITLMIYSLLCNWS